MTIATEAFASLAESAAKVLGHEHLPVVIVGHPVATLPPEQVHAMAEQAVSDIVRGLTQPVAVPADER